MVSGPDLQSDGGRRKKAEHGRSPFYQEGPVLGLVGTEPVDERTIAATGARCLVYFADHSGIRVNRKAIFDALQEKQATSIEDLVALAKTMEVEFRIAPKSPVNLAEIDCPVLVTLADGRFAILLDMREDGAVLYGLRKVGDVTVSVDEFRKIWTGTIAFCDSMKPPGPTRLTVWSILRGVTKYKGAILSLSVSSICIYSVELFVPIAFLKVLDSIIVTRSAATLDVLAVIMLILLALSAIVSLQSDKLISALTRQPHIELTSRFTRHVLSLPSRFFEDLRASELQSSIKNLSQAHRIVLNAVALLWVDLLFIFVFFAVAFYFSELLGLIMLARFPLYLAAAIVAGVKLRQAMRSSRRNRRESSRMVLDIIDGIETIKSRRAESYMTKRIEANSRDAADGGENAPDLRRVMKRYTGFIDRFATVAILWVGGSEAIAGALTAGQIVAVYLISRLMARPMNQLARTIYDFQVLRLGIAQVNEFLKEEPEFRSTHLIKPRHLAGHIRFANVRFRYDENRDDVLRGVSFEIQPGEIVGIVGPSGSGKSTVLKLIQRLHLPTAGRIELDQTGIEVLHPHALRDHMGFVPQDCWLFGQSIADNIALGAPLLSKKDILEAARIAGAHDFITRLPKGYETPIEGPASLSGGERQRIAIARAIVHQPGVLLFDESTSALDYETETTVVKNLTEFFVGRTVIIVAHRYSALRHVNKIISLHEGGVAEIGTPAELLRSNGYFSRMIGEQAALLNALEKPAAPHRGDRPRTSAKPNLPWR